MLGLFIFRAGPVYDLRSGREKRAPRQKNISKNLYFQKAIMIKKNNNKRALEAPNDNKIPRFFEN